MLGPVRSDTLIILCPRHCSKLFQSLFRTTYERMERVGHGKDRFPRYLLSPARAMRTAVGIYKNISFLILPFILAFL
jgi:hypothetical protein